MRAGHGCGTSRGTRRRTWCTSACRPTSTVTRSTAGGACRCITSTAPSRPPNSTWRATAERASATSASSTPSSTTPTSSRRPSPPSNPSPPAPSASGSPTSSGSGTPPSLGRGPSPLLWPSSSTLPPTSASLSTPVLHVTRVATVSSPPTTGDLVAAFNYTIFIRFGMFSLLNLSLSSLLLFQNLTDYFSLFFLKKGTQQLWKDNLEAGK